MWCVVNATSWPLYPPEKEVCTQCTGGWVGPRAGLDGGGKSPLPPRFFLSSLCTLSELLCPDCPGFVFCLYCTTNTTQTYMPPAEFEPAIPASDRPQNLALDHSTTNRRIRSPDRQARNESLYRLSYRGPCGLVIHCTNRSACLRLKRVK